jgi:hypothetical protein
VRLTKKAIDVFVRLSYKINMNIKQTIEKFGGVRPMARVLEVPPSTIQSWKSKGQAPHWRIPDIHRAAVREGIDLQEAA